MPGGADTVVVPTPPFRQYGWEAVSRNGRRRGNQSHSVFLLGAEGGARIVEPGRIVTVVRFSGGMEVKGYG